MASAMEKVNVGLIGAGAMANGVHYPSLHEFADVHMAALCDLVPEKRETTARRFGIPATYADYREMVAKEDLDAVYILMPPHQLFDIVVYCLRAGLHVFIEKPPGITAFQTAAMARIAAEHGCLTATGFNRRFIPVLVEAKRRVEAAGRITQAVATFYKKTSALYYNGAVDVLTCDAIHAVDALRWLAGGEVVEVASMISRFDDRVENSWNALVRFDNGAVGVLLTNWNVGGRLHTFEVHAPGLSALIDPDATGFLLQGDRREVLDPVAIAGTRSQYKFYGFYQQARHFIDCIKSGRQPATHFADAVKTMELADRIRAAAVQQAGSAASH
ncbi:MAG TPA: Gfo/Idh/MocA family oxidoreductase [Limnochordia bacterium]